MNIIVPRNGYFGLPGRIGGDVFSARDGVQTRLEPRLDIRYHSPTGFAWGYGGSGPAQLALAILCDHLRDDTLAERRYQWFKDRYVANLPTGREWALTRDELDAILSRCPV